MKLQLSRLDALLLMMTIIWGGNYSVIKSALDEIPPIAFNGLRLALASVIFIVLIRAWESRTGPLPWLGITALALVNHTIYQLLFISALARTSVANSSLIIAFTPILVALITAVRGRDVVTRWQWAGTLLSAFGIYLVVGRAARVAGESIAGDLMMLGAVVCWATSTVASRRLLARHSPLVITGYSMAIGSAFYLPLAWPSLSTQSWRHVSAHAWTALILSAVFALCVAYVIWFTAVQRIGNTRTAIYSNMVPIAAMVVAWAWLGERPGPIKIAGAAAIVLGVALTKVQPEKTPAPEPA